MNSEAKNQNVTVLSKFSISGMYSLPIFCTNATIMRSSTNLNRTFWKGVVHNLSFPESTVLVNRHLMRRDRLPVKGKTFRYYQRVSIHWESVDMLLVSYMIRRVIAGARFNCRREGWFFGWRLSWLSWLLTGLLCGIITRLIC